MQTTGTDPSGACPAEAIAPANRTHACVTNDTYEPDCVLVSGTTGEDPTGAVPC